MLARTTMAFLERLEYHKQETGMWKAEFHGAVDVEAESPSLEKCRRLAGDILDEKLAAWVTGTQEPAVLEPTNR